jgi:hypothetical protein
LTDDVVANVRSDCLQFDAPSGGVISKPSGDVWSGVNAAGGTAAYYRICKSDDGGTESTTQPRAQGAISTSGAELNLSSVNLAAGATTTIDQFSLTLPAQ